MKPEQLAEIKARAERHRITPETRALLQTEHYSDLGKLLGEDTTALLAEVERLKAEATKATKWEAHLAETLHYAQLNEGTLSAEVERLEALNRAAATALNIQANRAVRAEAEVERLRAGVITNAAHLARLGIDDADDREAVRTIAVNLRRLRNGETPC